MPVPCCPRRLLPVWRPGPAIGGWSVTSWRAPIFPPACRASRPTDRPERQLRLYYGLNRARPWAFWLPVPGRGSEQLSGDQIVDIFSSDNRDQVFFTSGIFAELSAAACNGRCLHLVRDTYRDNATPVRFAANCPCQPGMPRNRFLGPSASMATASDLAHRPGPRRPEGHAHRHLLHLLPPLLQRRRPGPRLGRLPISDVLGADATVPGTSWAPENSFTYMIPEDGHAADGQQREGWCRPAARLHPPRRPAKLRPYAADDGRRQRPMIRHPQQQTWLRNKTETGEGPGRFGGPLYCARRVVRGGRIPLATHGRRRCRSHSG